MKKSGIQVGKTYHNGKEGRYYQERYIDAEGEEYAYKYQEDKDCVLYLVVRKGEKAIDGPCGKMTRQAMANWAKGEVQS